MTRLAVVPAAPVLLPHNSQQVPPGCQEVLKACDEVLAELVAGTGEVVIIAAADRVRDLTGPPVTTGPSTADHVADALLDRVGFTGVRVRCRPGDEPRSAAAWLFLADGSADVTDKSPRPGSGGPEFDADLEARLRGGELLALADVTDSAAMAVGCVTAPVWRAMAGWVRRDATCRFLARFAPFGVTYFVGAWTTEAGTR